MTLRILIPLLFALLPLPSRAAIPADWTTPLPPIRISGNLYYVGSRDLAAYLVTTPAGNILINANLESSPALIRHSVEQLGFRWADTKILLSSQAHYDHVAGAAQILRETHARHMVMEGDAQVIRDGGASDFDPSLPHFPPARVDRVLHDGDTVTLGGTVITAHRTAGHTRGCTTWTMQTTDLSPAQKKGDARTLNVVIVGGWAVNPGVRLLGTLGHPASYPGIAADLDRTFATLAELPCDIFLGAHGLYFNLLDKLARLPAEGPSVWIDPEGYRRAVAAHHADYQKQLAQEQPH